MLGKRLAIAMLLEKGYDHRTIHSILKVSTTTVSSVNFWLQTKGKGYRKVIRAIQDSKKWNEFFVNLTAIFSETFSKKAWYRRAYGGMTDKEK